MPKQIFCAKCGTELYFIIKALKSTQQTITVVEPHECPKNTKANPFKDNNNELIIKPKKDLKASDVEDLFKDLEFSSKVGGNNSAPNSTIFDKAGEGDKRSKDDIRDDSTDVKSLAPQGVLAGVKSNPNSDPENDLKDL